MLGTVTFQLLLSQPLDAGLLSFKEISTDKREMTKMTASDFSLNWIMKIKNVGEKLSEVECGLYCTVWVCQMDIPEKS